MALIICDKHGESVVSYVSPAIADAVNGVRHDVDHIADVRLQVTEGAVGVHPIDSEFASRLQREFGIDPNDLSALPEEQSFEILCELKLVCAMCFNEWTQRRTR